MQDDEKVISIHELRKKRIQEQARETGDITLLIREELNRMLNLDYRRTEAAVYAANHAREWAAEGARLQSLREQAGVSRTALAKALGVSQARIARLEQGLPVRDARLLQRACMYAIWFLRKGGDKMNTPEVVKDLATRMGAYQKDVKELILEHFRGLLLDALARGDRVKIAGIGTFYPEIPRRGRPPASGQRQPQVRFKPASDFSRELRARRDGESR